MRLASKLLQKRYGIKNVRNSLKLRFSKFRFSKFRFANFNFQILDFHILIPSLDFQI